MKRETAQAYAKINLTLDVLDKRQDGYHNMSMVMQSISLRDRLDFTMGEGTGVAVSTNLKYLPNNEKNLAAMAAQCFAQATGYNVDGLQIAIHKEIPVCAGLAGGSSDSAAVLRTLNQLTNAGLSMAELAEIGSKVGSDVPFCVMGGTAWAQGRGEILTQLPPLPQCYIVLCKPSFSVATPDLFSQLNCTKIRHRPDTKGVVAALEQGDLEGVARRMFNVFEAVLDKPKVSHVHNIKNIFLECGALGTTMSGTGPTVFGIFHDLNRAQDTVAVLKKEYKSVFLAEV